MGEASFVKQLRRRGRTETVAVRLDPRLRYMLELAARQHRRTVSSFLEWMVDQQLLAVELAPGVTVASVAEDLWDLDRDERLRKLATRFPHLLTYSEEREWKQRRLAAERTGE